MSKVKSKSIRLAVCPLTARLLPHLVLFFLLRGWVGGLGYALMLNQGRFDVCATGSPTPVSLTSCAGLMGGGMGVGS